MSNRFDSQEHPVAFGLVALVGVATVVGLILGLATLAGSRVMGFGGEATTTTSPDSQASMYLPKPTRTKADEGPEITLGAGEETSDEQSAKKGKKGKKGKQDKKKKDKSQKPISLSAGQTSVTPMERIDLTGTYPTGEGALVQVQRFEGGRWEDFPVSPVTVSNQTFSTYIQTGQPGQQRFRVVDNDSGKPSNEVRVTVE